MNNGEQEYSGPDVTRPTPFGGGTQSTALPRPQFLKGQLNDRIYNQQAIRTSRGRKPTNETFSLKQQQDAARRLVTAPAEGEVRDYGQDQKILQSPGIAGLSKNAVPQKGGFFQSVSDPLSGFSVPNQANEGTRDAFNRYFAGKSGGFYGNTGLAENDFQTQAQRDSDPTRAAFQNRFFASETLKDVGIG